MVKTWDTWNLRIWVLISFACQVYLLSYGRTRKQTNEKVIQSGLWLAYLTSDSVATLALGVILAKVGDEFVYSGEHENYPVLMAFWASLLLVHLGGPPTITALAFEDNALWTRMIWIWIFQSLRVLYIILLAWRNTWFSYLSIGMLLVGIIEHGLRTGALYLASFDSLPDLTIFDLKLMPESSFVVKKPITIRGVSDHNDSEQNPRALFGNFKSLFMNLFVDLTLTPEEFLADQQVFKDKDFKEAFELVGKQLGYAYDVFYTKSYVLSSKMGRILSVSAICITAVVFICFCVAKDTEMQGLPKTDRNITWSLVVGVVYQEYFTFTEHIMSDWNKNKLTQYSNLPMMIEQFTLRLSGYKLSNVINQSNLLTSSLQNDSRGSARLSLNRVSARLFLNRLSARLFLNRPLESPYYGILNHRLGEKIFQHLVSKSKSKMEWRTFGVNIAIESTESRRLEPIEWTKMLEFHQSIITWHVATDLCYSADVQGASAMDIYKEISRTLSNYMMYLLIMQRRMLPVGRGKIILSDTFKEARNFFRKSNVNKSSNEKSEAYQKLLQVWRDNPNEVRLRTTDNSALGDACRLASSLLDEIGTEEERWEFLTKVWIEILGYAATQCNVVQHVQQLSKGGEFLTHVWLLIARLGLMEQFLVSDDQSSVEQGNTNETARNPEDNVGEGGRGEEAVT